MNERVPLDWERLRVDPQYLADRFMGAFRDRETSDDHASTFYLLCGVVTAWLWSFDEKAAQRTARAMQAETPATAPTQNRTPVSQENAPPATAEKKGDPTAENTNLLCQYEEWRTGAKTTDVYISDLRNALFAEREAFMAERSETRRLARRIEQLEAEYDHAEHAIAHYRKRCALLDRLRWELGALEYVVRTDLNCAVSTEELNARQVFTLIQAVADIAETDVAKPERYL